MCRVTNSDLCSSNSMIMQQNSEEQNSGVHDKLAILLELASVDDLPTFRRVIEEHNFDVNRSSCWYGRRIDSKKMGFEERTPLMIAAMFGSTEILKYIVETKKVDVNKASSSDGVTALHCAVAGNSNSSLEIIKLLLNSSADANLVDANGNKPIDLIPPSLNSIKKTTMEMLLKGINTERKEKEKEFPIDVVLPDINSGIYSTDEFRMYSFKIKPCSRAYSHDWTACPFAHPGENARRRDPSKYNYSCVPCPEFKKGSCRQGDNCNYAHGVFESWLHPAQYRTRLCKDESGKCARKVCFFAHKTEELRPLYASTGSAMLPPSSPISSRLKPTLSGRDLGLDMEFCHSRIGELKPTVNFDEYLGNIDPLVLCQLQGLSLKAAATHLQSPNGLHSVSSPLRKPSSLGINFGLNPYGSVGSTKRSQSFIDRGVNQAANSASLFSPRVSNWGSPDGKLDWGINGDEMNKLKKFASFRYQTDNYLTVDEPDVSWVNSLVKDVPSVGLGF